MGERADIAASAARRLMAIASPAPALVGFDGFIDRIVRMVGTRRSMAMEDFDPIRTIPEFARRCAEAAGRSTNIEQVLVAERFGGNGPLMAGSLARLGMPTAFVGAVGDGGGGIHPVFRGFAARCARVVPIGPPSWTLCMEFEDGKVMLNDTREVQGVTWERVVGAVGMEALVALVEGAGLLGVVNWSLLGGVPGIWRGLAREVMPRVSRRRRVLFVDLSDPAKRTEADVSGAMGQLGELEASGLEVVLGLNLAEAQRVAGAVGVGGRVPGDVVALAERIRARVGVSVVVVHPREGAAGAGAVSGAWFDGPFTRTPTISTGAGDHFNAGFAFAHAHGLTLEESLATGCAVSGWYVRRGESPTREEAAGFLGSMPGPE